MDLGEFAGVVDRRGIGQVSAREKLANCETPALRRIVVLVGLNELVDRKATLTIVISDQRRTEVCNCHFSRIFDEDRKSVV